MSISANGDKRFGSGIIGAQATVHYAEECAVQG
jgi:hypothetical protein